MMARDDAGMTPLDYALHYQHESAVSLLLDSQQMMEISDDEPDIQIIETKGATNETVMTTSNVSMDDSERKLYQDRILELEGEVRILRKKLEQAVEDHLCCICIDQEANALILPCSHLSCCEECIKSKKVTVCPICSKGVEKVIRVYK